MKKTISILKAMLRMGLQKSFGNDTISLFGERDSLKTKFEHIAKIEINYQNTIAADATRVVRSSGLSGIPPRVNFNCNHPFVFIIHDSEINEILFMGIYRNPNQ